MRGCHSTSVEALPVHMQDGCRFYDFHQNLQNVRSDIAHFQVTFSSIEQIPAQVPGRHLYADVFSLSPDACPLCPT